VERELGAERCSLVPPMPQFMPTTQIGTTQASAPVVEKPAKRLGVFPVLESLRITSHTHSIVCSSPVACPDALGAAN
jgi:hypothetical protein